MKKITTFFVVIFCAIALNAQFITDNVTPPFNRPGASMVNQKATGTTYVYASSLQDIGMDSLFGGVIAHDPTFGEYGILGLNGIKPLIYYTDGTNEAFFQHVGTDLVLASQNVNQFPHSNLSINPTALYLRTNSGPDSCGIDLSAGEIRIRGNGGMVIEPIDTNSISTPEGGTLVYYAGSLWLYNGTKWVKP